MKYSDEFKEKVLSLKGIDGEYAKTILNSESSGNLVGSLLTNYLNKGVPVEDVIAAHENNDFQWIYELKKDKLAAQEVLEEWMRDYYPQYCREFFGNSEKKKSSRWGKIK